MANQTENKIPGRSLLGTITAATAGLTIVPNYVVAGLGHKAPSDKLNIAGYNIPHNWYH